MKSKIIATIAVAGCALALAVGAARADIIQITATPVFPTVDSPFTIVYNDLDGDGLFSLNDDTIVSFSGFDFVNSTPHLHYDTLAAVPTLSGVTDGGYVCGLSTPCWEFTGAPGEGPFIEVASLWTYSTQVVSPVPEPSTWAMMILGFAGLGFMAYRRRNGTMLAA